MLITSRLKQQTIRKGGDYMPDIFLKKDRKKKKRIAERAFNLFAYMMAGGCLCISIFFILTSIALLRS